MAASHVARYDEVMSDTPANTVQDPVAPSPKLPEALGWIEAAEARLADGACIAAGQGSSWGPALVERAMRFAELSSADVELLLPLGARDLAALLWRRHDRVALAALAQQDPLSLKVRERIRVAVTARLDAAMVERPAVEAAGRFLARPDNAPLALQLGWATADGLWRWAGDTATDQNHYSKRALLCAILASTMAVRLSRGEDAAVRHLDASIARVMSFETWKAKLPPLQDGLTVLAANLGRLRYRS